ncbi:hypothetical protein GCM10010271_28540 [Streptomyces kurssanovii]|nr:hypothetical protein GCM10010271_28540 [Streptomyces kurssanovii]
MSAVRPAADGAPYVRREAVTAARSTLVCRLVARRRRSRAGRAAAVAVSNLALVLSLPGNPLAAPGDLDPAFGGDGRVLTGFGSDADEG